MTSATLLILIVIFIASATLAYVLATVIADRRDLTRRLGRVSRASASWSPSRWWQRLSRVAQPVARLAMPASAHQVSALRLRLMNAGIRDGRALAMFFACKALLALGAPVLVGVSLRVSGIAWPRWGGSDLEGFGLLGVAAIAYLLPNVWLARRVQGRQREIFEAFPDALDLMLVCVQAGLGPDLALARAGSEIRLRSAALADELDLVSMDLRMGASRERALRNLALRTGVAEVGGFVTMVTQADRFGTSMGDALRVQADALRVRRQLDAQERAARIPLKLLFPLIAFIFPSLFTVLLGPAVIRVWRTVLPALGAGG